MQPVTKSFSELSTSELFNIYKLRNQVFIVEQNCAYQDPDDKDLEAQHVLMWDGSQLMGYARLLPPGVSYVEASIGRVVVGEEYRGDGLGKRLMKYCLEKSMDVFQVLDIVISAQVHLLSFYTELGFFKDGSEYLKDEIPHIKMRYKGH